MPAQPIFGEAMTTDGRVYIRVPLQILRYCQRLAKAESDKPGAIARELILEGFRDGGTPALVEGANKHPLNVSLPEPKKQKLIAKAEIEYAKIGHPVDVAAYTRRCLLRGIELRDQPQRQKAMGEN